jgi:hypothetical protein
MSISYTQGIVVCSECWADRCGVITVLLKPLGHCYFKAALAVAWLQLNDRKKGKSLDFLMIFSAHKTE